MREILFRGKTIATESEWVEGFYNHIPCGRFRCDEHCIQTIDEDGRIGQLYTVYDSTVGQFTGLTDKNGKKIFEGDILEYISDMICLGSGYKTGAVEVSCRVVEWGEYGWIYKEIYNNRWNSSWNNYGRKDHLYKKTAKEFATVIGNIHDNPELLEGSDS